MFSVSKLHWEVKVIFFLFLYDFSIILPLGEQWYFKIDNLRNMQSALEVMMSDLENSLEP